MEFFIIIVAAAIIITIIGVVLRQKLMSSPSRAAGQYDKKPERTVKYFSKPLMTASEQHFFETLAPLQKYGLRIFPQVPLVSVITKQSSDRYRTELFRVIDFGIFTKDSKPLVLIELNDASHKQHIRKRRDQRVRQIIHAADIPLLTFYTDKPNEQSYVLRRIAEEIKKRQAA